MKKIMTIVGTRPEIIKLSCVINEIEMFFNHVFVHTGQNYDYELNEIFFEDLELRKPDYFLCAASKSVAETISNIIVESDKIMEKKNPMQFWFMVIRIVAFLYCLLKEERFQFFIWKQVIDVLINEFPKN